MLIHSAYHSLHLSTLTDENTEGQRGKIFEIDKMFGVHCERKVCDPKVPMLKPKPRGDGVRRWAFAR